MTVGEFFDYASGSPLLLLFYFLTVPFIALLAWVFGSGEGHKVPWRYLYSILVYLACVPGIFAIALVLHLTLIERHSILDMNVFMTVLPFLSMLVTLYLIRRNVDLDLVPGFDRLTGFLIIIFVAIAILWFLMKVRILVFTYMPFHYFIGVFLLLLGLILFAWRKITR